jgi:hypothetical protein
MIKLDLIFRGIKYYFWLVISFIIGGFVSSFLIITLFNEPYIFIEEIIIIPFLFTFLFMIYFTLKLFQDYGFFELENKLLKMTLDFFIPLFIFLFIGSISVFNNLSFIQIILSLCLNYLMLYLFDKIYLKLKNIPFLKLIFPNKKRNKFQ